METLGGDQIIHVELGEALLEVCLVQVGISGGEVDSTSLTLQMRDGVFGHVTMVARSGVGRASLGIGLACSLPFGVSLACSSFR